MSAIILEFPLHLITAHHCDPPPDRASAEVIPFPVTRDGLTQDDMTSLEDLAGSLGDGWHCLMQCDPSGERWAVMARRCEAVALVCRYGDRLTFFDLGNDDGEGFVIEPELTELRAGSTTLELA